MSKRNIGYIELSCKVLLAWLQFENFGEVLDIRYRPENNSIKILLEHPEMPEVEEEFLPLTVMPLYTTHQDNVGNMVVIREPLETSNGIKLG